MKVADAVRATIDLDLRMHAALARLAPSVPDKEVSRVVADYSDLVTQRRRLLDALAKTNTVTMVEVQKDAPAVTVASLLIYQDALIAEIAVLAQAEIAANSATLYGEIHRRMDSVVEECQRVDEILHASDTTTDLVEE